MDQTAEKGGGTFQGIKLLLCENPLPPIEEAILAAQAEAPRGNFYTEPYSAPLRQLIGRKLGIPEKFIHINAGSELILRQIFDRFGQQVHLLTPTYPLFPEIAKRHTETRLLPENNFAFDLSKLPIPQGTTLAVVVNPNNPNGGIFDMSPLPELLRRHPDTRFLVDEAFIGLAGESVVHLVPLHSNLLVTRTLSKAHSLAGFRVGYAVLPEEIADDLNRRNDAYPLARPSQAAAIATLRHEDKIRTRAKRLHGRPAGAVIDIGPPIPDDSGAHLERHQNIGRGTEVLIDGVQLRTTAGPNGQGYGHVAAAAAVAMRGSEQVVRCYVAGDDLMDQGRETGRAPAERFDVDRTGKLQQPRIVRAVPVGFAHVVLAPVRTSSLKVWNAACSR